MSKSKKQPVYDLVFLKPLEGFVVDEVVEKAWRELGGRG